MNRVCRGFLVACCLLALSGVEGSLVAVAEAAVPRTIHYQGKLTEPDGSPITGDHTVTLRLYDAATGGTKLWEEAHQLSLVRDDNGVFSVVLGSTTPFSSTITFNEPLWLTIEVDGAGEFLPRQPLSAVSYAINADQLDGLDATQFVQLDAGGFIPDATLAANVSRLGSSIDTSEITDSTLAATDTADTFLTAGSGVTVTKAAGSWTIEAGGGGGGDITGVIAGTGLTGGGMTIGGTTLRSGVVQAASESTTIPSEASKLRRVCDIRTDMWLLMVEAGAALFLLVFIVWWTMYSGQKPTRNEQEEHSAPENKDPGDAPPR